MTFAVAGILIIYQLNFDFVYHPHLYHRLVSICEFCMIFSHLVHALHNNSSRAKMIASVVVTVSQPCLQHVYVKILKLIRPIDECFPLDLSDAFSSFCLACITTTNGQTFMPPGELIK
uniref:Uncharacterized protein n=1 Tax=Glossina pallidipes TaxID=7398 RepID=A0A1A9ZEK4_GLOPL